MLSPRLGVLLLATAFWSPPRPAAAAEPTLRDDAYHYQLFRDGEHDANYVEWWYFNVVDESRGLELALTYSILDPDNGTGFGSAGLLAIAYTPAASFHQSQFFPASSFHGSPERADLAVDDAGFVEVLAPSVYRIAGRIEGEHRVSWDLLYVSESAPWLGHENENVGLLSWEKMSWLVFMPRALVSGTVVVDGERYVVDEARGYHDHNWGEWILTTVIWNWGQYSEPGFDLELGDFRRRPVGKLSIEFEGGRVVFDKEQYLVLHTSFGFHDEERQWYPDETWVVAINGRFALAVRVRARETQAILPPPHIPFLLVKPLLFEQTADYEGGLWERDGTGKWRLVHVLDGGGFKEYATRTWARP